MNDFKNQSVTIKKMETEDEIKGKAFVHWKSWHETYTGIINQNYLDDFTLEKCENIASQWTKNIFVAKDKDQVVGFVGYGKYHNDELENAGEVYSIYILSEYYAQGIGYRLMQSALLELSEYDKIAIWVLKENERTWKKGRMMRNMCRSDMGMCRCCSGKFTKIKAVSFRMCTKNC